MPLSLFESISTETGDLFVIHLLDVSDDSRSSSKKLDALKFRMIFF